MSHFSQETGTLIHFSPCLTLPIWLIKKFLGDGALQGLAPKLVTGGYDDVPTLKTMSPDDMDLMKFTRRQKDALEIRSYLHDRSMMLYADRLESSGKSLDELLRTSTSTLYSQFRMKRAHIARFLDQTNFPSSNNGEFTRKGLRNADEAYELKEDTSVNLRRFQYVQSPLRGSPRHEQSVEQSMADFKIDKDYVFKGIVAYEAAEPRFCGCIRPPQVMEDVAPYSSIENIAVQKLTPEYKTGIQRLVTEKSPPLKAWEIWREKPAILLCLRRPGCVMCRAEAHQLYARKPVFDALGFQLIAVLHEQIESEVDDFWPRYWGGSVVLDRSMDFFRALGGGKLLKDKFITGFVLNPRAIANYKRAKATGLEQSFRGGEIKGGLFIVGSGRGGIGYQFIERNFGDWAPIAEVIDICSQMQVLAPQK